MLEGVIGSQIVLFIIALLVGTAMAAFFGFLIGIPVLRLRGDYLAIVTLAFGEIIKISSTFFISQKTEADSTLQSRTETRLISQMTVSG